MSDRRHRHNAEMQRRRKQLRQFPSRVTRKNYRIARERCGLKPRKDVMLWGLLSRSTSFAWQIPKLGPNVFCMWRKYKALREEFPEGEAGLFMLKAIAYAFGVEPADTKNSELRDGPVGIPRCIAAALLYADGMTMARIARTFGVHRKSLKHMILRGQKYLEEWINAENAVDWGFAPINNAARRLPFLNLPRAHADLSGEQAGHGGDRWRPDRGEGSSFG